MLMSKMDSKSARAAWIPPEHWKLDGGEAETGMGAVNEIYCTEKMASYGTTCPIHMNIFSANTSHWIKCTTTAHSPNWCNNGS
jgi:hypothetical protein